MPAPPVTNPTPYTCPNCGAGLTERADFCPRCGASLQPKTIKSAGWSVSSLALGFGVLVFGGIGACSASVTLDALGPKTADYIRPVVLGIAVPLLLIGIVCTLLCALALLCRLRK